MDQRRQGREALTFQPGPTHLAGSAFWCRLVEGGIQPESGDDGDRLALVQV